MHVFRINIDVVKEVLIHKTDVAVDRIRLHGEILVQIKGDYIFKAQPFFLVESNQKIIHLGRGRSGCQAEHRFFALLLTLTDQVGHFICNCKRRRFGIVVDVGWNTLEFSGFTFGRNRVPWGLSSKICHDDQ